MTKKFKKEIKKMPKKFMVWSIIFAMLVSCFSLIMNVFAESFGTGDNFINFKLKLLTSITNKN